MTLPGGWVVAFCPHLLQNVPAAAVADLAWSNMLNFFKRLLGREPAPRPRPAKTRSRNNRNRPVEPYLRAALPVPEVVEGNDHTDWELWEDSVVALDSQMHDIFSRVGKNRDL